MIGYNPPWPPAPDPVLIRVVGSEPVSTADGVVAAWVVSYDGGGAPTTIWIAREDLRFLRLRSQLRAGATFWKIPVRDLTAWRAGFGAAPQPPAHSSNGNVKTTVQPSGPDTMLKLC
jgi:hypothetical protein